MSLLDSLSSINKISILAFFVTLGFLIYEIKLFLSDKTKKSKPVIPQFDQSKVAQTITTKSFTALKKNNAVGQPLISRRLILLLLTVMVILFGSLSVLNNNFTASSREADKSQVVIQEVRSSGIKIYNNKMQEITDKDIKAGDTITVGIQTVDAQNIDSARIRINKKIWDSSDITTSFDANNQVFFKTYPIASNEAQLHIEAQLHSKTDGWLSE